MNKIFKVIRNPATGNVTVASETAKSRGKKSGRSKLLISALVVTSGLLSSAGVYASVGLDGGTSAEATPATDDWIAIGKGAVASTLVTEGQTAGVAIGTNSYAAEGATALGYKTQATGVRSVALGQLSKATGNRTIAIGSGAESSGDYSLALGRGAAANAENSIAMGSNSSVVGDAGIAIGNQTIVSGNNSVALGAGSVAERDNTVSVGSSTLQRKVVNMAAGDISTDSTDAINGSQLYAISKSVTDRLGGGATVNRDGTVNAPTYRLKSGNFNNVGAALTGLDNNTLQWDTDAFSAAHGTDATSKITNVKAGTVSSASTDAINGSQLYGVSDSVADALGGGSTVNADGSITGPTYSVNNTDYTNMGDAISALDASFDDALLWDASKNAFSAAHGASTTSKIINVAAGTVSDKSTDAINGSQLYGVSDSVADALGGGSTVNTDGSITGPTYTVNNTDYTNMGDAITALDASFDDALLWDASKSAFSAAHGTSTTSKIINVAAGTVSDTSTDAINGSQLYGLSDSVADALGGGSTVNADGSVTGPTYSFNNNTYDSMGDVITALDASMDDALLWDASKSAFSAAHGTSTTSKIINVAAGTVSDTSTDAINGSQLYGVSDSVADALGGGSTVNADGSVTGPTYSFNNNTYDSMGDVITALDASMDDALLWDASKSAFSAAHGTSTTSKIINVAAGTVSDKSTDAINGSQLYGLSDSVADIIGGGAAVNTDGTISAPTYTIANNDYNSLSDALTALDTTLSTVSAVDSLQWDTINGAFNAAHGTSTTSKIINVAAGTVSNTSTDAVNGSQLYGVSDSVADALGGGASVNADGSITAPSYSIANSDYDNVGDALSAIDATLDDALLWDSNANAFSASHNGIDSKITNVAAGTIADTSTDAVNGGQLYGISSSIAEALGGGSTIDADGHVSAPTFTIDNTEYNSVSDALNATTNMITQITGDTSATYIEENGAGVNYIRTNDTGLKFHDASASGNGATAVGYNAVASADNSLAMGMDSSSTIEGGVALGSGSTSNRVIVKGSRNTSISENGVVIGYDTTDGELLGALSVGTDGQSYRQIINVADGSEAHDVVTVRQLQNAIGAVATTPTKYFHANSTEEDALAVGTDAMAMGAKTVVNGNAGIGIGYNTLVVQDAINGIAIGSRAQVNHADSIAIGSGSQTTVGAQSNYTAYNMDAPQNSVGEFSVGSADGQRQITNVAAGSQDTDAVNVAQLKVTDSRVTQNTQSIDNLNNQVSNLDTRVTNIENGIGDIVSTGSTKYFKTNTTGADANAQGTDSVAIGSGTIAAADNSVALGTGSVADEENTISVGSSTNQRRITNVAAGKNDTDAVNVAQLKSSTAGSLRYETNADGTINYSTLNLGDGKGGTTRISNVSAAVNDNDAVNYAQLKQNIQETKQYTDQRMVEMDHKLSKTESKLSGGIASAMAMTGLPQAYAPGASMASIGGGTYNGESAVALGVSMVSASGSWVYKLQGSTNSQGDYSAAIGAGIQW
ncbi:YadA-like family protein [Pseudocitrobacter cyperus]|uniref:YadA-like family protein n=1 Tax=Pseudocitrobacter cyperus TaxID=3112843 RepID=A0ABV0HMY6_9ENTR